MATQQQPKQVQPDSPVIAKKENYYEGTTEYPRGCENYRHKTANLDPQANDRYSTLLDEM